MKTQSQPGEFTGRHMLIIMLAFFGVVISVNTYMAVQASRSWTGLVVPNSYVASQGFDKETARRMQALDAGAQASVNTDNGYVVVVFKGRSGEPLEAENIVLRVSHPVDPNLDKSVALKMGEAGTFKTEQALPPGTWVGEVSATLKGYGDWVQPVRFLVKG